MSKSVNSHQSDMILLKMQENPSIARGFTKENKSKVNAFWKQLTLELNSAGPPIKNEFEWKKVWSDQKRYVRNKASSNKIYEKGTGGGPNKTKKFSPSEETIFQLVGMKTAVEGVVASTSFGLQASREENMETNQSDENVYEALVMEALDDIETVEDPTPISGETVNNSTATGLQNRKGKGRINTHQVLMDEIEIQKELCNKVEEAIGVMKEHNAQLESSLKKIYRGIDSIHHQQKERLKEKKRHNREMESLRLKEVESKIKKNQKIIELHTFQLKLLNSDENVNK